MHLFILLLILLALFFHAFFAGAETALVSANKMRLRTLYEKGGRKAKIAYKLVQTPHKFLAMTLVGTNLCVVTESVLATLLCIYYFGVKGPWIATFIMVPIALVFGEMLPKIFFRLRANQSLLNIAPLLLFFQKLLYPAIVLTGFLANSIVRMLGVARTKKNPFLTKEDIRLLVQEITREGVLEEGEEETIGRIFEFGYKKVQDVMISRDKVVTVNIEETKDLIKEKAQSSGFTRFPVFDNKKIIGLLNIFDLFYNDDNWHNHIRPIRHVYTNQRIDRLFSSMKPNKETMAIVMRHNRMIGIVTIADIMEEIVLPR